MSAIRAYARARARASGFATPVATVRHVHVAERPLVFVPLEMAGEANAPLAAMVGTDPDQPTLLVVPQPRTPDLRFAFAAEFADIILSYVESFVPDTAEQPEGPRLADAPQLIVPNPGGVEFVRLFGRSTRFRRTEGEYAVKPNVPILGRWLTFFAECAEHPGSSLMLAATDALVLHWATGQSAIEDANLAALMSWLAPPPGRTGAEAAREAENPRRCPPAGPATDPWFDRKKLVPAIAAYDEAIAAVATADPGAPDLPARRAAVGKAVSALEALLRGQLQPTWDLMWQALARLHDLPSGASVATRWDGDRDRFATFHSHMSKDGRPQARRDEAVAAARRLNRMERAQAALDAERAFDDPLVMADLRISGEAFIGTAVAVERDRRDRAGWGRDPDRIVPRPLVTVRTEDPVNLMCDTEVVATTRRRQGCVIKKVEPRDDHVLVTMEVRSGMGWAKTALPGTVPQVGDILCYSSVLPDGVWSAKLPDVDATPWTHGGPPVRYEPNADDAPETRETRETRE